WARRNRRADGDRRGDLEGAAVPGAPLATGDAGVMTDRDTPPEFRELLERAAPLPKSIAPPPDLWPAIETRIAGKRPGKGERERGSLPWVLVPLAAAATPAVGLLGRPGPDAPRGLFFVDTPAGTAVDLGCAYTVAVDSGGNGRIRVTGGYVEFDWGGRRSIVPLGFRADTRQGFGPGTPYAEDASQALRQAVAAFDFANGGPTAVRRALAAARSEDAVAVWHLLERVDPSLRRAVYDRL